MATASKAPVTEGRDRSKAPVSTAGGEIFDSPSPAPPPPTISASPDIDTSLPSDMSVAFDDQMVEIPVYDAATDSYVKKAVHISGAREMLDRNVEMRDPNHLSTEAYDQDLQYLWVNASAQSNSMTDARANGFAPVRDCKIHAHLKRKIEGLGEVVTIGDLVLFALPKYVYEERERRRIRDRQIERAEVMNPMNSKIVQELSDGHNVYPIEERNGRKTTYFEDGMRTFGGDPGGVRSAEEERAMALADSLERAQAAAGMAGGTNNFAGFGGPMGPGIPESPYLRKLANTGGGQ